VEYPQRNETNSTVRQQAEDMDLDDVNRALTVLRENAISMLDLVEKDFYNFYSTDVDVIKFVDKEIMKKILQFKQDIKNIVVYSKNLQTMHEEQGRLFYD
jgi:hypothetical protein